MQPKLSDIELNLSIVNILVVSHDDNVQNKVREGVHASPLAHLTFANTAKQALTILRTTPVDILLGDVDTPDLDGWRLSRLVRSGILKCPTDIPIIMVSSTWCERIAEVTAREYGINHVLPLERIGRVSDIINDYHVKKTSSLPKVRLLVVEDQSDTSDLIRRVLGKSFDIDIADDGEKGLQVWREGRHELVLLDVMLPKLSGKDVLVEIMNENPDQAVVIMTAHASIDQAEELMLTGAVDFISKPFRAEQLRKVCNIASLREDYLVSNAQFADRVQSLKERESAYKNLYESHHRLLDDLQSVVMELDKHLTIKFLNRTWELLMGFSITESLGRPLDAFVAEEEFAKYSHYKKQLTDTLKNKNKQCEFELCLISKQKQKIWTQLKISSSTSVNSPTTLTICLDNITERKQAQSELEHLAMHDSLTGLYNRYYFESSLEQMAEDAKRYKRSHALIYIDLDYFKVINDTFGHHRGDEVLREIAQLLNKRVNNVDLLCRLGGDEFAVLIHDIDIDDAKAYATDIQTTIGNCSFELHDQRIHLGSSIGLAAINGLVENAEEYLMQADIALYVAKGRGRNLIHLYDPNDQESEEMRLNINWSQKIREGISDDRIILYFQPVFDVNQNSISYYEALVRYKDVNGHIIGPQNFIPALENTGEMQMLDRRIIDLAIATLKEHPQLKHIAINLSAQAFKDESLVPSIIKSLEKMEVTPNRLTFELTESASLFNLSITQRVISELHQLGCSFSVDDFGSGFSSFSYLKQLPADYIKLDGSFIQNLHKDEVDQALVRSIVQVIQALGKKAVAEYVENEEILVILKSMGIDFVQGYHIGHPMPVGKLFPIKK